MAGPASAAAGWPVVSVPHTGSSTGLNAMSARATRGRAAGINGTDQALILSHG
jgi:hypothetical protein